MDGGSVASGSSPQLARTQARLRRALNAMDGVHLHHSRVNGWPRFPLAALENPDNLLAFVAVLDRIATESHTVTPSEAVRPGVEPVPAGTIAEAVLSASSALRSGGAAIRPDEGRPRHRTESAKGDGGYLPDLEAEGVDIAWVSLKSTTGDFIAIRAKGVADGIRYAVVDEYKRASSRSMTRSGRGPSAWASSSR